MAVSATSLKLPAALKTELEDLARQSGQSTHAVMVRALSEHVAAAVVNEPIRTQAVVLDVSPPRTRYKPPLTLKPY